MLLIVITLWRISRSSTVPIVFPLTLDTSTYNRTISSNILILNTQAAITQLSCTGVEVGSQIDLMKQEESSTLVFC